MRYRLTKMHGCGNDFLILDYMKETDIYPLKGSEVASLCDRNFGLGADGLVMLSRGREANANWHFWNADGSEAEMCGNAARCAVRFLEDRFFPDEDVISVQTKIGIFKGQVLDDHGMVEITLKPGGTIKGDYVERLIKIEGDVIRCYCIDTGVPHAVVEAKELRRYPINKVGAALVNHEAFSPNGTNVTFFEAEIGNQIVATTFERGVERETMACGTGAAAAALIYSQLYMQPLPIEVIVPGGVLVVDVSPMSKKLLLRGPTDYVFETSLEDLPEEFTPRYLYSSGKSAVAAPSSNFRR